MVSMLSCNGCVMRSTTTDDGDKSLRIALKADRSPYGRRDYLEPSLELFALS